MIRKLADLELRDKTVFVRVDFNVPIDDQGKITEPHRIDSALPTIRYHFRARQKNCRGISSGPPRR